MNTPLTALVLGICAAPTLAGPSGPTHAYIIEGSAFFGAPGIELARVGYVNLSDPSDVTRLSLAGDFLRFGGADIRPASPDLVAFENTTNALRIVDLDSGGNTLIDSIGFMDSGVAGMSYSNDGSVVYVNTIVGGFLRIVTADANTGAVLDINNILNTTVTSLAVVPDGHPTLNPGDLYGLTLSFSGGVQLARIDLDTNTIASTQFVSGIGFNAQFETGLDFAPDGTLYAVIQGFDEVSPDVFVEISSHLYTINPTTGAATDLGVIEADATWDAVTIVIDTAEDNTCFPDLTGDGALDFFDISAFLTAYSNQDPAADFNNDGQFDFFDISAFLNAYSAGCP